MSCRRRTVTYSYRQLFSSFARSRQRKGSGRTIPERRKTGRQRAACRPVLSSRATAHRLVRLSGRGSRWPESGDCSALLVLRRPLARGGLLVLVIALTLGGVWITVLLAGWNRLFFDALQEKNYAAFVSLLGRFGALAALYIATRSTAARCYRFRWRRWLTERYSRDRLAGRAYYLLQVEPSRIGEPRTAHPGRHRYRHQPDPGSADRRHQYPGDPGIFRGDALAPVRHAAPAPSRRFGRDPRLHGVGGHPLRGAGSVATHLVGRALIGINFDLQRYDAESRFRVIAYAKTRKASRSLAGKRTKNSN